MYKAAKASEAGNVRPPRWGQACQERPSAPHSAGHTHTHGQQCDIRHARRTRASRSGRPQSGHARASGCPLLSRRCVRCRAGPTQAPRSRRPRQTTPTLPTPETYLLRCAALRAASSCTRMLRLMRTTRVTTRLLGKRLLKFRVSTYGRSLTVPILGFGSQIRTSLASLPIVNGSIGPRPQP